MHTLRMQEPGELGEVSNGVVLSVGPQRVVKGYIQDPVAVLDVENHGVAAQLTPAPDNPQPMVAAGHNTGQINCPNLEVAANGNSLLRNGAVQNPGYVEGVASFDRIAGFAIGLAAGLGQLRGGLIRTFG